MSFNILYTKLSLYIENKYIYGEFQYNYIFCKTIEKYYYTKKDLFIYFLKYI